MTRREIYLLVSAAALVAAVGWQYWPDPSLPNAAPAKAVSADAPADAALNPLAARGQDALADLSAHPLFSPSRQPVAAAAPAIPEVAAPAPVVAPAEPPAEPVAPVLQGVVTTPAPGGAFIADGQGGASIFLRPGQAALGLSLEEVTEDSATFRTADGEVTLTLVPAEPAHAATDTATQTEGAAVPSSDPNDQAIGSP